MCRRREVPTDICDLQAQADQGQVYYFRGRYRPVLPIEVILGAVWHKKLYSEFRASSQLQDTCGGRIQ